MVEDLLASMDPKIRDKERDLLLALGTAEDAQNLLTSLQSEYDDNESEIEDLTYRNDEIERLCGVLEELVPKWRAALDTPELQEKSELLAAIHNPNQAKFPFLGG